jgi:hypothetical protein
MRWQRLKAEEWLRLEGSYVDEDYVGKARWMNVKKVLQKEHKRMVNTRDHIALACGFVTALRPALSVHHPSLHPRRWFRHRERLELCPWGGDHHYHDHDHDDRHLFRTCTELAPEDSARLEPKQTCISQVAFSHDATRSYLYASGTLFSRSRLRSSSGPWLYTLGAGPE